MRKLVRFTLLFSMMIVCAFVTNEALADDSKIPIMSKAQREQVFSKTPNFQGANVNYFFELIITPTGVQLKNTVLDPMNYTAIKNNVGFFTACGGFNNGLCEPPVVTTSPPTSNYCPIAKMILVNQDGYLNKTYTVSSNGTVIKDLTGFIYPSYCYAETGPNPINGKGISSIPEFPVGLVVFTAIFVGVVLLGRMVDGHWIWSNVEVTKI